MKTWFAAAAVTALTLGASLRAEAQGVVAVEPRAPLTWISVPTYYSSAYVPPYSYYAALPAPARGYVPYGSQDQFPFYGNPYGHPYDPWTWSYIGGGYQAYMARYFYPPVP